MKILKYPHRKLRKISKEVKDPLDRKTTSCIQKMLIAIQQSNKGIGLAAIQIGIPLRIIVFFHFLNRNYQVMINPKIFLKDTQLISIEETCLSIPFKRVRVPRYKSIAVEYLNIDGNIRKEVFKDFHSILIQHEVDHLDGKLIIDYEDFDEDL